MASVINAALLARLEQTNEDRDKTLAARKRLCKLADRVLKVPKPPTQRVLSPEIDRNDPRPPSASSLFSRGKMDKKQQQQQQQEESSEQQRRSSSRSPSPSRHFLQSTSSSRGRQAQSQNQYNNSNGNGSDNNRSQSPASYHNIINKLISKSSIFAASPQNKKKHPTRNDEIEAERQKYFEQYRLFYATQQILDHEKLTTRKKKELFQTLLHHDEDEDDDQEGENKKNAADEKPIFEVVVEQGKELKQTKFLIPSRPSTAQSRTTTTTAATVENLEDEKSQITSTPATTPRPKIKFLSDEQMKKRKRQLSFSQTVAPRSVTAQHIFQNFNQSQKYHGEKLQQQNQNQKEQNEQEEKKITQEELQTTKQRYENIGNVNNTQYQPKQYQQEHQQHQEQHKEENKKSVTATLNQRRLSAARARVYKPKLAVRDGGDLTNYDSNSGNNRGGGGMMMKHDRRYSSIDFVDDFEASSSSVASGSFNVNGAMSNNVVLPGRASSILSTSSSSSNQFPKVSLNLDNNIVFTAPENEDEEQEADFHDDGEDFFGYDDSSSNFSPESSSNNRRPSGYRESPSPQNYYNDSVSSRRGAGGTASTLALQHHKGRRFSQQQQQQQDQSTSRTSRNSNNNRNRLKSVVSGIFNKGPAEKEKQTVECGSDLRLKKVEESWAIAGAEDSSPQRIREKEMKLKDVKLNCAITYEEQQERDEKELAVTFTERFVRTQDGSTRPLVSKFFEAAKSGLPMPAKSWHIDFSVLQTEEEIWNLFCKHFYRICNSGSHCVLLDSLTFSGVIDGFDCKPFCVPLPSVSDFEDTMLSATVLFRRAIGINDDGTGGVGGNNTMNNNIEKENSFLFFKEEEENSSVSDSNKESNINTSNNQQNTVASSFRLANTASFRNMTSSTPTSTTDNAAASTSSPLSKLASFRRQSSAKTLTQLERFRMKRYMETAEARKELEAEQEERKRLEEEERKRNEIPPRTMFMKMNFVQCVLDNSSKFFDQLSNVDDEEHGRRVAATEICLEHCKFPRILTDEEQEAQEDFQSSRLSNFVIEQAESEEGTEEGDDEDEENGNDNNNNKTIQQHSSSDRESPNQLKSKSNSNVMTNSAVVSFTFPTDGESNTNNNSRANSPLPQQKQNSNPKLISFTSSQRTTTSTASVPTRSSSSCTATTNNNNNNSPTPTFPSEKQHSKMITFQEQGEEEQNKKTVVTISEESINNNNDNNDFPQELERDPGDDFTRSFLDYVKSQAGSLTKLSLHGTRLSKFFVEQLSMLLRSKRLFNLKHLDIGLTGLEYLEKKSPILAKTLASAIAHCPSLEKLVLTGMALSPPFIGVAFAAAIRANVCIKEVQCVGCDRGGTKFEVLIQKMLVEREEQRQKLLADALFLERSRKNEISRLLGDSFAGQQQQREATAEDKKQEDEAAERLRISASISNADFKLEPSKSAYIIEEYNFDDEEDEEGEKDFFH